MPSLFPETFGYVVLEAFAVRTPVVVHQGGGALHETGVLSGGGLGYRTDAELLAGPAADRPRRRPPRRAGRTAATPIRTGEWSEAAHLDRYFGLIQGIRAAKAAVIAPPSPQSARAPTSPSLPG